MISFKDFLKKVKFVPGWNSSHKEQRIPFLPSWNSSHKEQRKDDLKENFFHDMAHEDAKPKRNKMGSYYDSNFHDHPDVEPKKLTAEHKTAIKHYSQTSSYHNNGHASSQNMNNYLRNRAGDKSVKIQSHHASKVDESVRKLSKAFTPENTNRKEVQTFGAVPEHVGNHLKKSGKGSRHSLPGFTSTSSARSIADSFASQYGGKKHIIHYHIKPGAGLSVAKHSKFDEDEVLLHHGAHIEYHGTKTHKDPDTGDTVHVHHVTVHPTHTPLEHYGEYTK